MEVSQLSTILNFKIAKGQKFDFAAASAVAKNVLAWVEIGRHTTLVQVDPHCQTEFRSWVP